MVAFLSLTTISAALLCVGETFANISKALHVTIKTAVPSDWQRNCTKKKSAKNFKRTDAPAPITWLSLEIALYRFFHIVERLLMFTRFESDFIEQVISSQRRPQDHRILDIKNVFRVLCDLRCEHVMSSGRSHNNASLTRHIRFLFYFLNFFDVFLYFLFCFHLCCCCFFGVQHDSQTTCICCNIQNITKHNSKWFVSGLAQ